MDTETCGYTVGWNYQKADGQSVPQGTGSKSHDILVYQGQEMGASGCHNKGTRVMTTAKKSLPIGKVRVRRYSGGYYAVAE